MVQVDTEWSLKVRSKEIIPVLWNALLFVGRVFPYVAINVSGNTLTAYSGDGYLLTKTSCDVEGVDEFTIILTEEDAEKLLEFAKKVKDLIRNPGYVNIRVNQGETEMIVNETGTEENPGQEDMTLELPEIVVLAKKIIQITEHDYEGNASEAGSIRILPDRLSGMWRMKVPASSIVKGLEYPMDWKYFESPHNPGQTIAVVKYGPRTILVIAGLHRVFEESHPDLAEKCLWKTNIKEGAQPHS